MRLANEANAYRWPSPGVAADTGLAAVKRENEQLRLLTDELGHRIKNLLAIIQSIARQTMHQTSTKDDFEARFTGRLGALSHCLDLLTARDWHAARIDDLVRLELAAFGALDGMRISLEGPPLDVNPNALRTIGLALHELATNASKYGALSVPEGKVAVRWGVEGRRLLMTWREFGGPIVTEPKRWGFGRQVIQLLTAQALEGKVAHEFLPGGVRWTLDIPAAFVVGSCEPSSPPKGLEGKRNGRNRHVR